MQCCNLTCNVANQHATMLQHNHAANAAAQRETTWHKQQMLQHEEPMPKHKWQMPQHKKQMPQNKGQMLWNKMSWHKRANTAAQRCCSTKSNANGNGNGNDKPLPLHMLIVKKMLYWIFLHFWLLTIFPFSRKSLVCQHQQDFSGWRCHHCPWRLKPVDCIVKVFLLGPTFQIGYT